MNNFDQEFKRIVDGLDIDVRPGAEHKDKLRWQMMSEFNYARAHGVSTQGGFYRIRSFIMDRKFASVAAAAIIIAVVLIGISVFGGAENVERNIVNNDEKIEKVEQVLINGNDGAVAIGANDDGDGVTPLVVVDNALGTKRVNQLYAAKDVDALFEVLKTGSTEGKLAAANYLADMGADGALEELKKLADSWEGSGYNPFAPLVEKIEAGGGSAKGVDGAKGAVSEDNAGDSAGDAAVAVDKDNQIDTALGLKVIDKVTGKPVVGAEVMVMSSRARKMATNRLGRCLIDFGETKPSFLTIEVKYGKYVPRRIHYNPSFYGIEIPKNYLMALEEGTVIGGIVKTEGGEPVADATVKVTIHEVTKKVDNPAISSLPCKTDKDGRWICDLIPANARKIYLEVVHADLVGVEKYGNRASIYKLREKSHVLLMCPGKSVVGSVVDVDGKPIAGADVFQGYSKYSSDPKTKTDAAGKFVFQKCPPGEMVLSVKADGFAQDLKIIQVGDGLDKVEFVLDEGGTVIARFVDVDGKPVQGVRIEAIEWRKKTMDQPYDNIRIVEHSDADGLAVILNAPDEEVIYSISKEGFADFRNMILNPSDKEQEVVLFKPGRLVGKVVDPETGEAIKEFRVIEGIQKSSPKHSFWKSGGVTWQNNSGKKVTGGRYVLPFNYHVDGYAVKIEADGYLPQVSPIFYNKGVTVQFDILLSRGEGPSGLVYDSDGKAVVNADVIIATKERSIQIENNLVLSSSSIKRTLTDKEGAFNLPAVRDDYKIVVNHDDGVAIVTRDEFQKTNAIILEKWGRLEGVLYKGAELAVNNRVHLGNDTRNSILRDIRVSYQQEVKSNDKGEFVFEKVLPGKMTVSKIVELNKNSWTFANKTPVDVAAGKRSFVEVGGGGREITGRIILPAGISLKGLNPSPGGLRLKTKADKSDEPMDLPEMSFPEDFLVMSRKERNAWQAEWEQSEEGKAFLKKVQEMQLSYSSILKNYPARLEADGSFVIEDVLPGKYELTGLINDISLKGTEEYYRSNLCYIKHEVLVEEIKESDDYDKPLDLGDFKVNVLKELKVGDSAPGFELRDLDGEKISLSDFKGKYLLLEKSMGNRSDYNTKVLPGLMGLYAEYGGEKFEILGVYNSYIAKKDIIEKPLNYFVKYYGIGWSIGLDELSMIGDNSKITEAYGMKSSVMHLITPDGKIAAIEHDIDKMKEIISSLVGTEKKGVK